MTVACYEDGNNEKSNNNEDMVCLLLKTEVGRSYIKSHNRSHAKSYIRSHNHKSYNHSVTPGQTVVCLVLVLFLTFNFSNCKQSKTEFTNLINPTLISNFLFGSIYIIC